MAGLTAAAWLPDGPYGTIHRLTGSEGAGIFQGVSGPFAAAAGARICGRTPTRDNHKMQRLLEQNGFRRCGTIYVRRLPRIAYQLERIE